MPALTVVITGDAKKLEAEMAKINALAAKTGQNIRTSLNTGGGVPGVPGGGGGGHGGHPNAGAMRESLVLVRELARGDFKRAASSFSILISRLGLLSSGVMIAGAAIAGFIAILWGLDKVFKALAPKEDTLGLKSITRGFDRFQQAAMQSKIALQTWIDEMKRGRTEVEKLQASMADAKNTTDAWADSDEKKAESAKDLKLAQLENDRATGKISQEEFRKQKADVENKFEEDRFKRQKETRDKNLHSMYETADKADAEHAKASGELSGKAEAAARAETLRSENQARMETLKEDIKNLQKQHTDALVSGDGVTALRAGNALRDKQSLFDLAAEKMPGLEIDAKKSQGDLQRGQQEVDGLKKQAQTLREQASQQMVRNRALEDADKTKLENDKKIRALQDANAGLKGVSLAGPLTQNQRAGAYISPMADSQLQVQKGMHQQLKEINAKMGKPGTGCKPLGATNFG